MEEGGGAGFNEIFVFLRPHIFYAILGSLIVYFTRDDKIRMRSNRFKGPVDWNHKVLRQRATFPLIFRELFLMRRGKC